MWLVVSITDQDKKYQIVGDKKYAVGRVGCDITISDPSVSRKQAVLSMSHLESNVVKSFITPTLTLEDTSKFGTFVNGKSVRSSERNTVSLKDGDEIQFGGSPASKFKAVYETFIATTSCLEKAPKKSLQKIMCLLGGHVVRDWRNSCDLLIMSKINVTIKVICAINNQKHIVTPVYLDHFHKYLLGEREKPDPTDYLPEVVDKEVPSGVSFLPDVRRVTLLSGRKFYFLSAVQFNKTNMAVSTAGGLPILLEDGTEEDADAMTLDDTIVVSVSKEILSTLSGACQKFVHTVYKALKRHNLRMVTDPEIGWAILTCNTSDFCNPKSSITPNMFLSMAAQSLSQMGETQDATQVPLTGAVPQTSMSHQRLGDILQEETNLTTENQTRLLNPQNPADGKQSASLSNSHDRTQTSSSAHYSNGASGTLATLKMMSSALQEQYLSSRKTNQESPPIRNQPVSPKSKSNSDVEGASFSLRENEKLDISKDFKDFDDIEVDDKTGIQRLSPEEPVRLSNPSEKKTFNGNSKNVKTDATSFLLDDSDDDDDAVRSKKRAKKTPEKKGKKTSFLCSDSDENPSPIKRRKKNDVPLFGSDNEDETSDLSNDAKITCTSALGNGGAATTAVEGIHTFSSTCVKIEDSSPPVQVEKTEPSNSNETDAWVIRKTEVKPENGLPLKQESETEVFYDKDGMPVRNFCEVKMIDLVARPVGSRTKKPSPSAQAGGKNFKKFKKTQHVGSGQLPKIIGGRDLQPHIGNKLQALDDLLSEERQDERRTKRRGGDQLFGSQDDNL